MTTTTEPASNLVPRVTVGPVNQRKVITAEWLKLITLRSSWITISLGIGALAMMGGVIGFFVNRDWDHMRPGRQAAFDAVGTSLRRAQFTPAAIGVMGVVSVTGEYGTGMIRSTLTAVPKRLPVLWGKALVFGAVTLVLTEIASFIGFFVGQATLGAHAVTLSSDGALRAVIGIGLYLTVVALIGIALGFIIRSTAGGIAALVAILLVLPGRCVDPAGDLAGQHLALSAQQRRRCPLRSAPRSHLVGPVERVRRVLSVRRRRIRRRRDSAHATRRLTMRQADRTSSVATCSTHCRHQDHGGPSSRRGRGCEDTA